MNEVVKQKVLKMIQARKTKGFGRDNESSKAHDIQEEISFLVHEQASLSDSGIGEDLFSESSNNEELRREFEQTKKKIESILAKFKSKNPAVMKLLGEVSRYLSDFLEKLS